MELVRSVLIIDIVKAGVLIVFKPAGTFGILKQPGGRISDAKWLAKMM